MQHADISLFRQPCYPKSLSVNRAFMDALNTKKLTNSFKGWGRDACPKEKPTFRGYPQVFGYEQISQCQPFQEGS